MSESPLRKPTQLEPGVASVRPESESKLTWLPAWRIRELITKREVSPIEVTNHFLGRIEDLDRTFHAFRMVDFNGAREQAGRAEKALISGEPLGALHGIPIAVKEHIPIKGVTWHNLLTGTSALAERDAVEVERLRAAGAVIVGSTVAGLTALEFGESDRQPLNPWDTRRVCGDFSSGSACAAAAAMTPVTIAVDGLGSTLLPAAFCGLVGLRASRGRIPSFDWAGMNTRPLSASGPLTRDVRDAALVLGVLARPDGRDMMCLQDDPPDYQAQLGRGVEGMRLVWTGDFGFASKYADPGAARVIETVRRAAFCLRDAGAALEATVEVWAEANFAASVALASDRNMQYRREPPIEDIVRARDIRQFIWQKFQSVLRANDFILSPTIQYIAPTRSAWAASWTSLEYMDTYSAHTVAANLLGWPAISVPAGFVDGMPVGLQIMGKPGSEARMLQLAHAFFEVRARTAEG